MENITRERQDIDRETENITWKERTSLKIDMERDSIWQMGERIWV
jgi:hypothetical protein